MSFETLRYVAVRACALIEDVCADAACSCRAESTVGRTWGAPPDSIEALRGNQTLRQVVRVSIGGNAVRLRISNLFGDTPLTVCDMRVARHSLGSGIRPVQRGRHLWRQTHSHCEQRGRCLERSVPMSVAALEKLAVSMYLPRRVASATVHSTRYQTAYLSKGEATAAHSLPRQDFHEPILPDGCGSLIDP